MNSNIKRLGISAAACLVLLAIAIPAFTVNEFTATANPYEQQVLQARYDQVSARVNFATGVYTDMVTLVANASGLNTNIGKLNGDLSTLKGYVDSNDKAGFDNCVKGTIQPDIQAGNDALKADMKQFKAWGVSAATLQQLKADYQNRKTTLTQQENAAVIQFGNVRLTYYNDVMSRDDTHIADLSSKGIDVSGMQSVKAGAESSVIGPLQSAISSGDANAVKDQLKSTCLANGEPYSYHFFAKNDLAALKAVSAKIESNVNNSTVQQQLSDVNAKLSNAENALNAVGTSPYTSDTQSQVWDNLKAASEGLKTIIKELQ